ncbi:hypothetical protein GBJ32_07030 [Bifidobacterium longum]|uniref:Uncharacterized protein n=1 Tax=Bifidobacterium longum TaxID=216816 RepID=A0A6G0GXR4_BIFLN|nr:hypothetical protein GBJ29_07030 [Bifidobacterium longum]KAB7026523.1 hypothetical protein GBI75_07295 [Bifidobacterium longum]KAB7031445.1 hypothetical protein GBJ28_08500 [Bifidobacterium longum]KAB7036917.1 hypothetical protein GBJ37_09720 [Bifidobacterium longum]KAB7056911.1 hypothetical protein GBI87_07045 [Bifidobacterium longum]
MGGKLKLRFQNQNAAGKSSTVALLLGGLLERLELIRQSLAPINDALPTLLPQARLRSLSAMGTLGTSHTEYPKLYADSFNATLRAELADDPIDDWKITGSASCLHLRNTDTGLKLRFLKEFKFEGSVPPAGMNRLRREAWAQPVLLDQEVSGVRPLKDSEIVLVWTETNGVATS